jgi:hypothetical protein
MFNLIRVRAPLGGGSLTVNELVSEPLYPIEKFTWDYEMAGDEIPKFESPGQWDNIRVVRKMMIEWEGHIVTKSSTQYWNARKALMNLMVPAAVVPSEKVHVRIEMQLIGDGSTYYADCVVDDWSAPIEANYPTVTPVLFQLTCNFGYWRNIATNAAVRI